MNKHLLLTAPIIFTAGLGAAVLFNSWNDQHNATDSAENPLAKTTNAIEQSPDLTKPAPEPSAQTSIIPAVQWQNELEFLREEANVARADRIQLADELDAAQTARMQLEKQVQQLSDQLQTLALNDSNAIADSIGTGDSPLNQAEFNAIHEPAGISSTSDANAGSFSLRNRFGTQTPDEQLTSLVAAGVGRGAAEDIQYRQDQLQLARLELYDQATREGWQDSEQFADRLNELDDQAVDLRTEIGETDYDRYLFEAGRNNRVVIESVINGSAAQNAGLLSGDLIISYANRRMFTLRELQSATREGSRGEAVQLNVQRGREFLALDIPRGPLGVTLSGIRLAPST